MESNRNALNGDNGKSRKLITVVLTLVGMIAASGLIMTGSLAVTDSGSSSGSVSSTGSVATNTPIRIKESVGIKATNAAATGITVTNNDKAFIEFVSDVGDEVIVEFDIINESSSTIQVLITISTDANTLAAVDEAKSDFVSIRLSAENKWLASFPSGSTAGNNPATLALSIATLTPGTHTVTVDIKENV